MLPEDTTLISLHTCQFKSGLEAAATLAAAVQRWESGKPREVRQKGAALQRRELGDAVYMSMCESQEGSLTLS